MKMNPQMTGIVETLAKVSIGKSEGASMDSVYACSDTLCSSQIKATLNNAGPYWWRKEENEDATAGMLEDIKEKEDEVDEASDEEEEEDEEDKESDSDSEADSMFCEQAITTSSFTTTMTQALEAPIPSASPIPQSPVLKKRKRAKFSVRFKGSNDDSDDGSDLPPPLKLKRGGSTGKIGMHKSILFNAAGEMAPEERSETRSVSSLVTLRNLLLR